MRNRERRSISVINGWNSRKCGCGYGSEPKSTQASKGIRPKELAAAGGADVHAETYRRGGPAVARRVIGFGPPAVAAVVGAGDGPAVAVRSAGIASPQHAVLIKLQKIFK